MQLCVFSKHLQDYDIATLGPKLKSIGIDAVDLTVREGGHIEPHQAKALLPGAVDTLRQAGVEVAMITTNITDINEAHAQDTLATAAALGIGYYKIGYYRYFAYGTINRLLAESKAKLADIAAFNQAHGIWGGYHNHSASFLGANPVHIYEMLADLNTQAIGCYWDAGHAVIEGLAGSWDAAFDQLSPHIRMLAIKDLKVNLENHAWRCDTTPLGTGTVQWDRMCSWLKQIEGQLGPVSIHGEYHEPSETVLQMMDADTKYFTQQWDAAREPVQSAAQ